jgi:hypothetical protein
VAVGVATGLAAVALLKDEAGVQVNDVPPAAVNVVFAPVQIEGLALVAVTVIPATVTVTMSVAEHPFASVATIV